MSASEDITGPRRGEVDEYFLKRNAKKVVEGLVWFSTLRSQNPEKITALNELQEITSRVMDLMDIIAPEWGKIGQVGRRETEVDESGETSTL